MIGAAGTGGGGAVDLGDRFVCGRLFRHAADRVAVGKVGALDPQSVCRKMEFSRVNSARIHERLLARCQ